MMQKLTQTASEAHLLNNMSYIKKSRPGTFLIYGVIRQTVG